MHNQEKEFHEKLSESLNSNSLLSKEQEQLQKDIKEMSEMIQKYDSINKTKMGEYYQENQALKSEIELLKA